MLRRDNLDESLKIMVKKTTKDRRCAITSNKRTQSRKKTVHKQSKVDIIKKRIGLIDSVMGYRLAKKLLQQNGNNVTRAKLMVGRLETKPTSYTFRDITTNIVNLTRKINQRNATGSATGAKRNLKSKYGGRSDKIPTSIIFIDNSKIETRN